MKNFIFFINLPPLGSIAPPASDKCRHPAPPERPSDDRDGIFHRARHRTYTAPHKKAAGLKTVCFYKKGMPLKCREIFAQGDMNAPCRMRKDDGRVTRLHGKIAA